MTFSIVGRDPATGELGAAVQSKFPGVGSIVLHGRAGVGCITTQAFSNPDHGERGLQLLELGADPATAMEILLRADPQRGQRQVAILGPEGPGAVFAGEEVKSWQGVTASHVGPHSIAHGNSLCNADVPAAMVLAFENSRGDNGKGEIAARLIGALRAGQAAGGEMRGQQSAAVLVVKQEGGYGGRNGRHVDIQVYDHAEPIEELSRCYRLHRLSYFPSRQEDLIDIDDAIAIELKGYLGRAGYASLSPGGGWTDADITAMARFMGVENYDNRIRDDARIDREVLEDLRARLGPDA